MHRDKKLGMALGVLLVGIVAAFFFRNERTPTPEAPQLLDPQALDSRIAERPLGPYLTGVETLDDPSPPKPLRDDPGASRPKPDGPDPAPIPDRRGFAPLSPPAGGATSASGPIPFPGSSAANPPSRRYPHNDAWQAVSEPAGKPVDRPDAEESFRPREVRVHRVQPGDTLSGLAVRYLGSSARFREIYLANRDVLRSPDDLRVGMTLKIPAEPESRSSSESVQPQRTIPDEPSTPIR
jgi:nucleoid-associated protein YgaU